MDTVTTKEAKIYTNIKIENPSDDVWVSPVSNYEQALLGAKREVSNAIYNNIYIILLGPTGAGKSSFIEAIASNSTREPLSIAKDQLESVTQQPCIYRVNNLGAQKNNVYLIDTPGFADPGISELQILDKVVYWRDRCQTIGQIRVLYFHPISDIRLPASRKRCLDMIQAFWGTRLSARAMLVTSMWDRLPQRSIGAAETRFTQLSNSHWRDWTTRGSTVAKFRNTFESALDILDEICSGRGINWDQPSIKGLGSDHRQKTG